MAATRILCALLIFQASMIIATSNQEMRANDRALFEPRNRRNKPLRSARIYSRRDNSPALNHFLEDVLNARDELKWIDRAVHRSANPRRNIGALGKKVRGRKTGSELPGKGGKQATIRANEVKKRKRDVVDEDNSMPSLASLKRTVIELGNILDPQSDVNQDEGSTKSEGKRKLLSSKNSDSEAGIGFAIQYYDYEEEPDSVPDLTINRQIQRDTGKDGSPNADESTPLRVEILKKDENAEEEKKEELIRQGLKNKYPKEEFISDEHGPVPENVTLPPTTISILKRVPDDRERPDWNSDVSNSKEAYDEDANYGGELADEKTRKRGSLDTENEDGEILGEQTYLVLSPLKSKKAIKRSANFEAEMKQANGAAGREEEDDDNEDGPSRFISSNGVDKSARNYAALKSTDDMFKGGIEQSNPLVEDKPIVESPSFSSSGNSSPSSPSVPPAAGLFPSSRHSVDDGSSKGQKNPSGEWKLIEAVEKRSPGPKMSLGDEKASGRRLLQQIFPGNGLPINATSSCCNNQTKHENSTKIHGNFAETPSTSELQNQTRSRRQVAKYRRENRSKHPRRRTHRHDVNYRVPDGKGQSPVESERQRRKLTVLLAVDNIEDESQIDLAVHGELAGKIVEKIFDQVEKNEALKVALGPGLYRKHKPQESMALDKMYHQDADEVKETEVMMRRVMELLGRIVLDQVRRKTCSPLAPDMREFLQWSLGLEDLAEPQSDQYPPLPRIPGKTATTEKSPSEKFLFPNSTADRPPAAQLSELERKVNLLRSLINEYLALSEREKTKVQTVHDYLVRQLSLLLKYIETKEAAGSRSSENLKPAPARLAGQSIFQYQGSMPNSSFARSNKNSSDLSRAQNRQNSYSIFGHGPIALPYANEMDPLGMFPPFALTQKKM